MELTQAEQEQEQEQERDLHARLPNNPFVPPKGDICFINDLPPELLSYIFEVGAADNDSEDENDSEDFWEALGVQTEDDDDEDSEDEESDDDPDDDDSESSDSPLPLFRIVVSHVCRHWRDVALTTPSLWTSIVVGPEARSPFLPVSTFLERSKGLLVDIHVKCEPEEDSTFINSLHLKDLQQLYSQLLIPHIHRWRTIEVSVSEYRHMYTFLDSVSNPRISAASELTTLQLYHHEETEEFDFIHARLLRKFTLFGGSAPCLTNIVLWGVHVDWDQTWISSATRLVDLELAYHAENVRPTWAQLATMLRNASSLEKLSLRMSGPCGVPPEWIIEPTPTSPRDLNAPVVLPKVTDFVLAFHSQMRAIGLVHKLVLPAIKNLVLDFDTGDYTELVSVLVGPATSQSPLSAHEPPHSLLSRLESLKIAGLPCLPESIDILYSELRNVTSLNISLSNLDSWFLDILGTPLMLAEHGEHWLPRLTTLYVSGTSGGVLREVVEKRQSAGVPLESLYVEGSCDLSKRDREWLRRNLRTFELFEGSDDEDEDEEDEDEDDDEDEDEDDEDEDEEDEDEEDEDEEDEDEEDEDEGEEQEEEQEKQEKQEQEVEEVGDEEQEQEQDRGKDEDRGKDVDVEFVDIHDLDDDEWLEYIWKKGFWL